MGKHLVYDCDRCGLEMSAPLDQKAIPFKTRLQVEIKDGEAYEVEEKYENPSRYASRPVQSLTRKVTKYRNLVKVIELCTDCAAGLDKYLNENSKKEKVLGE